MSAFAVYVAKINKTIEDPTATKELSRSFYNKKGLASYSGPYNYMSDREIDRSISNITFIQSI